MKISGPVARRLIVGFAYRLLQVWARTIRFQLDDRTGLGPMLPPKPFVAALWHNRLLMLPHFLRRFARDRHGAALISASRDGELLAAFVKRFGFDVVRGSSSRQGATAIRQLADVLGSGRDVVITPDGPRGPAYKVGPGLAFLAQKTGTAIIPISMEYSSCWRLKNWDRFFIPRPFSTVRVIVGKPHTVPLTPTDDAFDAECLRLENAMMEIVETL